MGVVVLVLVFVVLGALLVGSLLAAGRSQGAESEIMQTGFAEPEEERLVDIEREAVAQVEAGVEGHGEGAPEPAGPPPVPGAQWDETHARWIVWEEHMVRSARTASFEIQCVGRDVTEERESEAALKYPMP